MLHGVAHVQAGEHGQDGRLSGARLLPQQEGLEELDVEVFKWGGGGRERECVCVCVCVRACDVMRKTLHTQTEVCHIGDERYNKCTRARTHFLLLIS